MSRLQFDREMILLIAFSWGAATSLGLVEQTIIPWIDAGETIVQLGNANITLGRLVSIATIAAVLVNRDATLQETHGVDAWIVYATIGLTVAPPLFPALQSTIAAAPAAIITFTVQSTGFMLVSYLN